MKKCSTQILDEIKKHADIIFSEKDRAPRKQTLDGLAQLARAYYAETTVLSTTGGVVLN